MIRYNPVREVWFLDKGSPAKALECDKAGFDFSSSAGVWFTNEPHAALPFWDDLDAEARAPLAGMKARYDASLALDGPTSFTVPPSRELMPFQRGGVQYALDRNARALIGDEPGLGKTIQAVVIANELKAKRVLIICPAAVRRNWLREIRLWSTINGCRPSVYVIESGQAGFNPAVNFNVVSYDLVRTLPLWFMIKSWKPELLVLDEAHFLKTPTANRTRSLFGGGLGAFSKGGLADDCPHIVALTGTYLPNRPREAFTLAKALCWESINYMNQQSFELRFNPSVTIDTRGGKRTWETTGRLAEMNARLRCSFMVRRHKKDVLKDLPAKRYELVEVDETSAIKKALAHERLLDIDPGNLKAAQIDGQISTVRREMGEALAPAAIDHVKALLDGGLDKLVVFAHHRSVMDMIAKAVASYGLVRIDGSCSPSAKATRLHQFINDGGTRVLLGQLQATGTGVDGLQHAAHWLVFAEQDWRPGENEQCVDRLHRHGQTKGVVAQFLVARGSISERIMKSVVEKMVVIDRALDKEYILTT